MAEVEVYSTVRGEDLERYIASMGGVQGAVASRANRIASEAARLMDRDSEHRTGKSQIAVDHAGLDSDVILDDMRDEQAAAAIEFGTKHGGGDIGALITAARNAEHGLL